MNDGQRMLGKVVYLIGCDAPRARALRQPLARAGMTLRPFPSVAAAVEEQHARTAPDIVLVTPAITKLALARLRRALQAPGGRAVPLLMLVPADGQDENPHHSVAQDILLAPYDPRHPSRMARLLQGFWDTDRLRIPADTVRRLDRTIVLLDSIRRVQALFIDETGGRAAFSAFLDTLVEATGSAFGFVDEVCRGVDGAPYKLSLALSNIAWDAQSRELYEQLKARHLEFRNLTTLAGMPAVTGDVLIANDVPHDPRAHGLPPGHPSITAFLGIPLYCHGRLVGVAGLANRPGGYDQAIVEFIQPLLDAGAALIDAWRIHLHKEELAAALRASDANARAIMDATTDSLVMLDRDGIVIDSNAVHAARLGLTPAELIGRCVFDLLPEEVREQRRATVAQAFRTGRPVHNQDTRTGSTFHYTVFPVSEPEGNVQRAVVYARNVTERIQAEENFRAMIDAEPESIFVLQENQYVFANPGALALLGYTEQELLGRSAFTIVHPDDRHLLPERIRRLAQGQANPPLQLRFVHRDGTVLYLETVSISTTYGGQPAILVLCRDITERQRTDMARDLTVRLLQAANQIPELEPLLREFVAILQDFTGCEAVGLRLLDEGDNIPYAAYVGFSADFYERESPLNLQRDACMCINVIKGMTDPDLPFYTAAGSFYMNATTPFLATVSEEDKGRTRNECNRVGYESVALIPIRKNHDILGLIHLADRREGQVPLATVRIAEEVAVPLGIAIQRTQTRRQLQESLAEKEVLLREVHHRVKNNLAAIQALVSLQRRAFTDPAVTGGLGELESRIRAMALVHERLYGSENLAWIDFQPYLEVLTGPLRASYDPGGTVALTITGPVRLGIDAAVPCGMIVNELVTNAYKHAFVRPPEGTPRITVELCEDAGCLRLVVADNGAGLPAGFDPDAADTLGLQLVRMLARHQLGGDLAIESGGGTRVRLTFSPTRR